MHWAVSGAARPCSLVTEAAALPTIEASASLRRCCLGREAAKLYGTSDDVGADC
jgi:hypothetical protein